MQKMSSTSEQSEPTPPPKTGAIAAYRFAWKVLKRHFLELVIILILSWLAALPLILTSESESTGTTLFTFAYLFMVLTPLQYGVDFAYLRAVLDRKPRIGDMLEFFNNYFNILIAVVLVHFFISIGFLLLIVPGIVLMCKLAFVPYLATFHRISALESIRLSWRMTRGYSWTIFRIWLMAIPLFLLGLAAVGVGVVVSAMWVTLANAALYYRAADQSEVLERYLANREQYAPRRETREPQTSGGNDKGLPNLLDR
jgi:hypothetical protein